MKDGVELPGRPGQWEEVQYIPLKGAAGIESISVPTCLDGRAEILVYRRLPEVKAKSDFDSSGLACGVYRLYWLEGGTSVASVGRDDAGRCWHAPANWISGPSFDWAKVERVQIIERSFSDCDG